MQVCCFWLWVLNALWQWTIIFHRHTLSYPHSLPRQFPLAKLPLSFSHIFPILFFLFVCFLSSSTIIWCFEMQNHPIPCKHLFLFLFWCISVGFDICKSSSIFYLSYLISDTPVVLVSFRAMSYLCYYCIAALFNTLFFFSIFSHLIFSKKQWFTSITIMIVLKWTVLFDLEMVGFPGMFFHQDVCLHILVKVLRVQRVI